MSFILEIAIMKTFTILPHLFEHLMQPNYRDKHEFGLKKTQISANFVKNFDFLILAPERFQCRPNLHCKTS